MTSQNFIYLSQLVDMLESWSLSRFHDFWVTYFEMLLTFSFVLCLMTSCHDVTEPDLPVSACRYARKLILFLFPWFFWSPNLKMLLIFYVCDVLTSWRYVMSQSLLHLSQIADSLEKWIFSCFQVFLVADYENVIVNVFVGWYHVISCRHDVASILSITLLHQSYLVVGPFCDSWLTLT